MRQSIALCFLLLCLSPLSVAQVYKCQRPSGVISYQDKPCAGKTLKRISVPQAPSTSAPAASSPSSAAPAVAVPPPVVGQLAPTGSALAAASAVPTVEAAAALRCTRADGSTYFTVGKLPRGQSAADGGFVADQCLAAERSAMCDWYVEQKRNNDAIQAGAAGIALTRAKREGQRLAAIHAHRCGLR